MVLACHHVGTALVASAELNGRGVRVPSAGSSLSPDPGGHPHPVDHQAPLLKDLQTPRDLQTDREGESGKRDQNLWELFVVFWGCL